jgi:hypothetical protein
MDWLDSISNPEAVKSLFDVAPPLDSCKLIRVEMEPRGTILLTLSVLGRPDRLPRKIKAADVNAVSVQLGLLGIEELELTGWPIGACRVAITPSGDEFVLSCVGEKAHLRAKCQSVSVKGLTPFLMDSTPTC